MLSEELSSHNAIQQDLKTTPSLSGKRLLIDGRKLGHGGIGRYLDSIVAALTNIRDGEVTFLVRKGTKLPNHFNAIEDNTSLYSLSEIFLLARKIAWKKFDLFHVPHYTLPAFVPVPTVITIHDLIHINFPEKFYYPFVATPLIRSSIKRATKIIAVSKATADEVCKFDSTAKEKLTVVSNAVPQFDTIKQVELPDVIRGKRFILSVISTAKPHKGLNDLIEAYSKVKNAPTLVIAGQGVAKNLQKDGKIACIGAVSEEELAALYQQAEFVVVPSLAEGFCYMILEAHSKNKRVVCRPIQATLELSTTNDIVAKDLSVQSLSDSIQQAVDQAVNDNDSSFTFDLSAYSLEHFRNKTVAVYNESCPSS